MCLIWALWFNGATRRAYFYYCDLQVCIIFRSIQHAGIIGFIFSTRGLALMVLYFFFSNSLVFCYLALRDACGCRGINSWSQVFAQVLLNTRSLVTEQKDAYIAFQMCINYIPNGIQVIIPAVISSEETVGAAEVQLSTDPDCCVVWEQLLLLLPVISKSGRDFLFWPLQHKIALFLLNAMYFLSSHFFSFKEFIEMEINTNQLGMHIHFNTQSGPQ